MRRMAGWDKIGNRRRQKPDLIGRPGAEHLAHPARESSPSTPRRGEFGRYRDRLLVDAHSRNCQRIHIFLHKSCDGVAHVQSGASLELLGESYGHMWRGVPQPRYRDNPHAWRGRPVGYRITARCDFRAKQTLRSQTIDDLNGDTLVLKHDEPRIADALTRRGQREINPPAWPTYDYDPRTLSESVCRDVEACAG